MRTFRITVIADRYPTAYTVQATSWPTAVARGVREWKRRFKGSHATKLTITAVKGDDVEAPAAE